MSVKAFSDVVIVSDSHLKPAPKYGKMLANGINSRLKDALENIKKSVDYAIEHKVLYWIHLGDIFDKLNPPESLRSAFLETISPLSAHGIKVIILIGNHDTDGVNYNLMSDKHLLASLGLEDIMIVKDPCQLSLRTNIQGVKVKATFIPWVEEKIILEWMQKSEDTVVFGHFGISGALVNGTEYLMTSGISQKLLNIPIYTFAGHYHCHQTTPQFMYIGSSYKVDFGERKEYKGFISAQLYPTAKPTFLFIDVHDRRFLQHIIHQTEDPDFNKLDEWKDMHDAVLKLRFIGAEDWFHEFNMGAIRSHLLNELNVHKLFIEQTFTDRASAVNKDVHLTSSWLEGLQAYVTEMKEPDMLEIGQQILEDVL